MHHSDSEDHAVDAILMFLSVRRFMDVLVDDRGVSELRVA